MRVRIVHACVSAQSVCEMPTCLQLRGLNVENPPNSFLQHWGLGQAGAVGVSGVGVGAALPPQVSLPKEGPWLWARAPTAPLP